MLTSIMYTKHCCAVIRTRTCTYVHWHEIPISYTYVRTLTCAYVCVQQYVHGHVHTYIGIRPIRTPTCTYDCWVCGCVPEFLSDRKRKQECEPTGPGRGVCVCLSVYINIYKCGCITYDSFGSDSRVLPGWAGSSNLYSVCV